MPNTPPSLADFAADITFSEDAVNAAPVLIDGDVTFTDAEGDFAGGMLILSGLLSEDRVGIRNEGNAPGEIGVSGTDVSYGGIVIGTVAGGVGASLIVTFNAATTPAAVDALIQNLTFADVSDTPNASRTLRLDIIDAGGAHITPHFNALTGGANPFGAVTSSGDSASAFADLDNDGLLDVVMGQFTGTLRVYHNEGNGTFTQRIGAANPFNGVTGAYLAPAFADLDGDGKLDALVGTQGGTLRAFHNNGNGTFTELVGAANPFNGVRVDHDGAPSYFAKPGFVDLDGDGSLDAVIGEDNGQLLAFHNNGDGSFTRLTGAANPFNGVDVGDRSAPSFVDLNGDGRLDAIVGAYDGTIRAFHNNGDGTFTPLVGGANPFDGIDVGDRATPSFGDLNGDGKLDALVGDFDGTLLAFSNNLRPDPAITITVTAVNDVPVSGGPGTASGTEDDASIGGTVPAASDLDDPVLTYSLVAGSVKVNNVTVADDTVTFSSDGTYSYATGAADQALDGTGMRVITFDYVANDGSVDSDSAAVTVTVYGVNDEPALGGLAAGITFLEGTVNAAPQIIDSDVVLTDPEGNFGGGTLIVGNLLAEDVVAIRDQGVGAGEIGVSGTQITYEGTIIGSFAGGGGETFTVTLVAAATVEAVDALIQNLTYANFSDTPTADRELTLDVTDAGGASFLSAGLINVTVTAVNDPPTGADVTVDIAEDGMHVFALADFGFSDPDGGNFSWFMRVIDAPDSGTIYYDPVGPIGPQEVGAGVGISYDAIVAGELYYVPNANGNGAPFDSFTFALSDSQGTANGGVNEDPNPDLFTFNVISVNDVPSGSDATFALNEDEVRTLTVADFGYGDTDGNAFAAIIIDSAVGGAIWFDADGAGGDAPEAQSLPRTFTAADLAAGKVTFVPDADLNGTGAASLTFRVQDDGGTADGGVDTDASANTLTFDIAAINDAPALTGLDAAVTYIKDAAPVLIDGSVVLGDAEGNFSGGTLTVSGLLAEDEVTIRDQGNGAGQIGVSGTDISYGGTTIGSFAGGDGITLTVTLNAAATVAAVDSLIQNLTYANGSGTPTPSRTLVLNVTDADGGELGGPAAVPASFAPLTGVANPFNGVDVGLYSAPSFIDVDGDGDMDAVVGDYPGNLRTFENTGGVFTELTGTANPFDGLIAPHNAAPSFVDLDGDDDLDLVIGNSNGQLRTFENDGSAFTELTGTANPFNGVDVGLYSMPSFVDLDGDGDLDAVIGANGSSLRAFENESGAFTALTGAANPFLGISDTFAAPSFVDLDGDGDKDLVLGQFSGTFRAFANTSGTFTELIGAASPLDGIDVGSRGVPSFVDLDGDGDMDAVVGNPYGTLLAFDNLTPHGQAIVVNAVIPNEAPSGSDATVGFNEDAVRVLSAADFGYGDTDGDAFAAVIIDSTAGGTIRFDADGAGGDAPEVQTLPQTFTAADLAAGRVTFVPDADLNGTGAASLTFHVQDDGGTAFGGIDTDASANTLTFDIATVNDAPALGGFAADVTFTENAAAALFDADVVLADVEGNFDGGALTVSGLLAEDAVAIRNQGSGAGQIGVSDADVTYGGTIIGSFAGGNGATLAVTFNAAATAAAVDALIQNLTYANDSDTPAASRTLVLNVTDADGGDLGPLPVPPSYNQLLGAANPFDSIDVGLRSAPAFVDLDGDGDMDVVVGDHSGHLRAFENEGGVFTELAGGANPFDGLDLGIGVMPSFADLDGDGDMDLVVGEYYGGLRTLQNDGGTFAELTGTANPFNGVDLGVYAAPSFADLDGDGDMDAVIGDFSGHLSAFENDGGAFTQLTGIDNPFHDLVLGMFPAQSFVDLDGDGDLDLVVGLYTGTSRTFENVGGEFTELTGAANPFDGIDVTMRNAPSFVDLDGDGDMDAVVGNYNGTLLAFEAVTPHGRQIVVNVTATDDASVAKDDSFATNEATAIVAGNLFANNGSGADTDIDGPMTIAAVNGSAGNVGTTIVLASGAQLTVQANGTYTYDPNHAFDDLPGAGSGASNLSDSDSFTYTLANGNTATVTITISGLDSVDVLLGTAAADTLDGGTGADQMSGGNGNDTYVVDNGGDIVTELAGQGTDNVQSSVDFVLGANVENLNLTGVAAINGSGNSLANILTGNSGGNILDGKAGADTMRGGLGSDSYYVDNVGDTVTETSALGGSDWVQSSVTFTLSSNVESLTLTGLNAINGTGNNLANILVGNIAANILNGGFGADTMSGGLGNDTYIIDNAGDLVTEAAGAGTDTVQTSLNHILGANVERLVLTGTGNLIGTGNGLANILTGNSGANRLDGGGGGDIMIGGLGNDSYFVDNGLDQVFESAGGGTDTVNASLSHDLEDEVENMILTGIAAINGTGNSLNNVLTGNGAANTLNGGLGADTLKGGLGDDTYVVDNVGDIVSELAGQGTDKVLSSVSYTLGAATENLTLTGSNPIFGAGNQFANVLIGNDGANSLDGGGGADTMNGGLGNDSYSVDNVGDVVLETSAAGGTDQVSSSVTFTLGSNIEDLILLGASAINGTGNGQGNFMIGSGTANVLNGLAGNDYLQGGGGNDQLRGGLGSDTLDGGAGNDGFYFDSALNDVIYDTIIDFTAADDTIFLDDAVFTTLGAGALAAGAFQLGQTALDADDRILYDSASGKILYDADGSGAASAVLVFTVLAGTAITHLDFIVY